MEGVSRYLSLTTAGSLTNASLGAESGVMVEVTQKIASGLIALVATQPAGRAGATTLSKFSANAVLQGPGLGVGGGVPVAVAVAVAVTVAVGVGEGVPQPCSVQDTFKPSDKLAVLQEKVEEVGPVPFCRPIVAEAPVPFNVP